MLRYLNVLLLIPSLLCAETVQVALLETIQEALISDSNPVYETTTTQSTYNSALYDTLFDFSSENELVLEEAADLKISDDLLTYTITLRDDIFWSDGAPVIAENYVFSFQSLVDAEVNSFPKLTSLARPIKGAADILDNDAHVESLEVTALNDKTLEIVLDKPTPYFTHILANTIFAPAPSHVLNSRNQPRNSLDVMLTNGKYTFNSLPEPTIYLVPNPHYRESVNLDGVNIRFFENEAQIKQSLLANETQVAMSVAAKEIDWYASQTGLNAHALKNGLVFYLRLNTQDETLKSLPVRQALAYLLNKENIALRLESLPAYSFSDPAYLNSSDEELRLALRSSIQSEERAIEILSEAGYTEDNPLKLDFYLFEFALSKRLEAAIVSGFSRPEIVINPIYVDTTDITRRGLELDYQLMLSGWEPDYPDASAFLDLWTSTNPRNRTGWSSSEFDGLIESASLELDANKRNAIYLKAEKLISDNAPIIPIMHSALYSVYSDKLAPLSSSPVAPISLQHLQIAN